MKYLLLIYTAEDLPQPESEAEAKANMARWFEYTAEMQAAGVHLGGEPLQDSTTATTVRVRNDETLTTDGPFAETKEVLAGYYLVDVPHLDDALKWASKCPAAEYGSIEVRPLMELPEAP